MTTESSAERDIRILSTTVANEPPLTVEREHIWYGNVYVGPASTTELAQLAGVRLEMQAKAYADGDDNRVLVENWWVMILDRARTALENGTLTQDDRSVTTLTALMEATASAHIEPEDTES